MIATKILLSPLPGLPSPVLANRGLRASRLPPATCFGPCLPGPIPDFFTASNRVLTIGQYFLATDH